MSSTPEDIVVGDVDGDLDLLTANYNNSAVGVRLNQGNGTFGAGSEVPVGSYPSTIGVGDLDGDSDLDLLTANGIHANTVVAASCSAASSSRSRPRPSPRPRRSSRCPRPASSCPRPRPPTRARSPAATAR